MTKFEAIQGIEWLLLRGVTLNTPIRSTFSAALAMFRYEDGLCEPYASEAAKELVRAVRKHLRRCERKGLPIMDAVSLPPKHEPTPDPVFVYTFRKDGPGLVRVAHPFIDGRPLYSDRYEVAKQRGRAACTVRHNGGMIAKVPTLDDAEDVIREAILAAV